MVKVMEKFFLSRKKRIGNIEWSGILNKLVRESLTEKVAFE